MNKQPTTDQWLSYAEALIQEGYAIFNHENQILVSDILHLYHSLSIG